MLEALVVFLPLLGSVIHFPTFKNINSNLLSTVAVSISAFLSFYLFISFDIARNTHLLEWLDFGDLRASWSIYIDRLTLIMFVVVNTVSACVHVYSMGYMPKNSRFFCYLSLFTFCMLVLVCSDNFAQLFFGWEGVGACSYLLIGFWFKKDSANNASLKAFIVNRLGDACLALGIFLVYWSFGSIEFDVIFSSCLNKESFDQDILDLACVLLFIGCTGKSAQLGLHVWLPDAMEGPTPVSALIHAATMVTAGIFLVSRCYILFGMSSLVLNIMLVLGAVTAIFAASVAVLQDDIKKIIAYSTCSQLGYMFMACGSGDFSASIFHLFTHAFFKALLFLCAGVVIYCVNNEQNIYKISSCSTALRKKFPVLFICMFIGTISIVGIFPFAGFFSKDLILEAVLSTGNIFAYTVAMSVVVLTAIYSFRLLFVVFYGNKSDEAGDVLSFQNPPMPMIFSLLILTAISIISGYLGQIKLIEPFYMLEHAYNTSAFWGENIGIKHYHISIFEKSMPLIFAFFGVLFAYLLKPLFFGEDVKTINFALCAMLVTLLSWLLSPFLYIIIVAAYFIFRYSKCFVCVVKNGWLFDCLYQCVLIRPFNRMCVFLGVFFDSKVLDGIFSGFSSFLIRKSSFEFSSLHSGFINRYAFWAFLGLLFLISMAIFVR